MNENTDGYILALEGPAGPLSARNLQDFELCPRKYLLSFIQTRGQTVQHIGGPAVLQRTVRTTLLEICSAPDHTWTTEQVHAAFENCWDGRACSDAREEEQIHGEGLRMVTEFVQQSSYFPHITQTDLRLEGEVGGHALVAFADLVFSKPPQVARFSTSRKPLSPGQLEKDLSWSMLLLLATRQFNNDITGLLIDLRHGKSIEYNLDEAALTGLEQQISRLAGRLRSETKFAPMRGKHCHWCRSRGDCPAWRQGR